MTTAIGTTHVLVRPSRVRSSKEFAGQYQNHLSCRHIVYTRQPLVAREVYCRECEFIYYRCDLA